jgi:hypothetical protein
MHSFKQHTQDAWSILQLHPHGMHPSGGLVSLCNAIASQKQTTHALFYLMQCKQSITKDASSRPLHRSLSHKHPGTHNA